MLHTRVQELIDEHPGTLHWMVDEYERVDASQRTALIQHLCERKFAGFHIMVGLVHDRAMVMDMGRGLPTQHFYDMLLQAPTTKTIVIITSVPADIQVLRRRRTLKMWEWNLEEYDVQRTRRETTYTRILTKVQQKSKCLIEGFCRDVLLPQVLIQVLMEYVYCSPTIKNFTCTDALNIILTA